jgi:hypothetical protein
MARTHLVLTALVLTAGLSTSGCTLCKPVVGAITGPVVMLGNSSGDFGGCSCSCGDGYALVAVLGVMAGIGAVGGLVTGIISDIQVLTGDAEDPTRNWADPFKTNTSN